MGDQFVSYAVNFIVDNRTLPEDVNPLDTISFATVGSQTGDAIPAILLSICILCFLVAGFFIIKNLINISNIRKNSINSATKVFHNSIFANIVKMSVATIVSIVTVFICIFLSIGVQKVYAEDSGPEGTINAHIDYVTGQIGFDTMNFMNNSQAYLKVKSSCLHLSPQLKNVPGLTDTFINIDGFDGCIYKGQLSQEPVPVQDAFGHVNPKQSTDITLSMDGLDRDSALQLEGETGFSVEFCFEDALVPKPIVTSEFFYDGKNHVGVACDHPHVGLRDNQAIDAGDYSAIATLDKGFIWEDETSNVLKIDWKISPAILTVITEDATKVYDGSPLTKIEGASISGFVEIEDVPETCTFNVTGSITDVGVIENSYEIKWDGTAKECNYTVNEQLGSLEITRAAFIDVKAENVQKFTYSGQPQGGVVTAKTVLGEDTPVYYSAEEFGEYSTESPKYINVTGSNHVVYYKIEDDNHETITGSYQVIIEPYHMELTNINVVIVSANPTYNGQEQYVTLNVVDANLIPNTLVKDEDYQIISGGSAKNVSSGGYKISIKGIGNYSGEIQTNATWNILPKSISEDITADVTNYVYDKKTHTPEPSLYFGSTKLSQYIDYNLSGDLSGVNAKSDYEIQITGTGNFKDTRKLNWSIDKRLIAINVYGFNGVRPYEDDPAAVYTVSGYTADTTNNEKDFEFLDINKIVPQPNNVAWTVHRNSHGSNNLNMPAYSEWSYQSDPNVDAVFANIADGTLIISKSEIKINVSTSSPSAHIGDTVKYSIELKNEGDGDVNNLKLFSTLWPTSNPIKFEDNNGVFKKGTTKTFTKYSNQDIAHKIAPEDFSAIDSQGNITSYFYVTYTYLDSKFTTEGNQTEAKIKLDYYLENKPDPQKEYVFENKDQIFMDDSNTAYEVTGENTGINVKKNSIGVVEPYTCYVHLNAGYKWTDQSFDDLIYDFYIRPVALNITAKDKTITYGQAPSNDGCTIEGLAQGDNLNNLTGTLTYTYNYQQYGNVGDNYTITPTGISSNNYVITYHKGKLKVQKKAVGITYTNIAKSWTGSNLYPDYQFTSGSLVNGDNCTISEWLFEKSGGGQSATVKDEGSYTATPKALSNANYQLPSNCSTSFLISNLHTVYFEVNGHGSPAPAPIEVNDGSKITAPSPVPVDDYYDFKGWYKDSSLQNVWNFNADVVTEDITLYAKWELARIKLTIDPGEGSISEGAKTFLLSKGYSLGQDLRLYKNLAKNYTNFKSDWNALNTDYVQKTGSNLISNPTVGGGILDNWTDALPSTLVENTIATARFKHTLKFIVHGSGSIQNGTDYNFYSDKLPKYVIGSDNKLTITANNVETKVVTPIKTTDCNFVQWDKNVNVSANSPISVNVEFYATFECTIYLNTDGATLSSYAQTVFSSNSWVQDASGNYSKKVKYNTETASIIAKFVGITSADINKGNFEYKGFSCDDEFVKNGTTINIVFQFPIKFINEDGGGTISVKYFTEDTTANMFSDTYTVYVEKGAKYFYNETSHAVTIFQPDGTTKICEATVTAAQYWSFSNWTINGAEIADSGDLIDACEFVANFTIPKFKVTVTLASYNEFNESSDGPIRNMYLFEYKEDGTLNAPSSWTYNNTGKTGKIYYTKEFNLGTSGSTIMEEWNDFTPKAFSNTFKQWDNVPNILDKATEIKAIFTRDTNYNKPMFVIVPINGQYYGWYMSRSCTEQQFDWRWPDSDISEKVYDVPLNSTIEYNEATKKTTYHLPPWVHFNYSQNKFVTDYSMVLNSIQIVDDNFINFEFTGTAGFFAGMKFSKNDTCIRNTEKLNVSKATDMQYMFYDIAGNIEQPTNSSLDIRNLVTNKNNPVNVQHMFAMCDFKIIKLPAQFLPKTKDFTYIFEDSKFKIIEIDTSKTSKIGDTDAILDCMFYNSSNLYQFNFQTLDASNVKSADFMVQGCQKFSVFRSTGTWKNISLNTIAASGSHWHLSDNSEKNVNGIDSYTEEKLSSFSTTNADFDRSVVLPQGMLWRSVNFQCHPNPAHAGDTYYQSSSTAEWKNASEFNLSVSTGASFKFDSENPDVVCLCYSSGSLTGYRLKWQAKETETDLVFEGWTNSLGVEESFQLYNDEIILYANIGGATPPTAKAVFKYSEESYGTYWNLTFVYDANNYPNATEIFEINPNDSSAPWNTWNETTKSFECKINPQVIDIKSTFFNYKGLNSLRGWFADMPNIIGFRNLNYIDSSSVTDFSYMFAGSGEVRSTTSGIDFSNNDTSNAINVESMFSGCGARTITLPNNFACNSINKIDNVFDNVRSLEINFNGPIFKNANIKSFEELFDSCVNITSLDLSTLDFTNITEDDGFKNMMFGCTSIDTIIVGSSFLKSNMTNLGLYGSWQREYYSGKTIVEPVDMSKKPIANGTYSKGIQITCMVSPSGSGTLTTNFDSSNALVNNATKTMVTINLNAGSIYNVSSDGKTITFTDKKESSSVYTVTANPAEGCTFDGWSLSGSGLLSSDRNIYAKFRSANPQKTAKAVYCNVRDEKTGENMDALMFYYDANYYDASWVYAVYPVENSYGPDTNGVRVLPSWNTYNLSTGLFEPLVDPVFTQVDSTFAEFTNYTDASGNQQTFNGMSAWFAGMSKLEHVQGLKNVNMTNIIDTSDMFNHSLTPSFFLDFGSNSISNYFKTNKVKNMSGMFDTCKAGGYGFLKGMFDGAEYANRTFANCPFTNYVYDGNSFGDYCTANSLFEGCTYLETVNIRCWMYMYGSNLFKDCPKIKILQFATDFEVTDSWGLHSDFSAALSDSQSYIRANGSSSRSCSAGQYVQSRYIHVTISPERATWPDDRDHPDWSGDYLHFLFIGLGFDDKDDETYHRIDDYIWMPVGSELIYVLGGIGIFFTDKTGELVEIGLIRLLSPDYQYNYDFQNSDRTHWPDKILATGNDTHVDFQMDPYKWPLPRPDDD